MCLHKFLLQLDILLMLFSKNFLFYVTNFFQFLQFSMDMVTFLTKQSLRVPILNSMSSKSLTISSLFILNVVFQARYVLLKASML